MELIQIKKLVEKHTKRKLNVRNREQDNVYCRALYCKLAKIHTKNSLSKIGGVIGRDHATVLHNLKLFDNVIVNYGKINRKGITKEFNFDSKKEANEFS